MTALCQCGCGEPVARGKRFRGHHHLRGNTNPRYKGGLYYAQTKRRWIIICRDGSRQPYARAVLEAQIKRVLTPDEVVHHINHDSADDRPENLALMTRDAHNLLHATDFESQEILLDALRRFYRENGRSPKALDFVGTHDYPHYSTYRRWFESWNKALTLAGLPTNKGGQKRKVV